MAMKQRDVMMIVGLIVGISSASSSYAQVSATGAVEQHDSQKLELTSGKSKVLDLPMAIKRASLANPEVADTVVPHADLSHWQDDRGHQSDALE
jgi:Flp pilus assembly secretin CpaC